MLLDDNMDSVQFQIAVAITLIYAMTFDIYRLAMYLYITTNITMIPKVGWSIVEVSEIYQHDVRSQMKTV
jgi:hypothetical protein